MSHTNYPWGWAQCGNSPFRRPRCDLGDRQRQLGHLDLRAEKTPKPPPSPRCRAN